MSYKNRTPSVKLLVGKNLFNKLLGILDSNVKLEIKDENFSNMAKILKNKLLKYSVPKDFEGKEYVDIRFFPYEASAMIWQLLAITKKIDSNIDFYTVLLENYNNLKTIE